MGQPDPVRRSGDYDERTALLVVDVQNDFVDPSGALAVPGALDALGPINREVDRASSMGALVVYTQDWHPPHTPHFAQDGGVWPVHCVADGWGAELHPRLHAPPRPHVVHKGTGGEDGYSAFSQRWPAGGDRAPTGLETLLRERDVTRVVIVGFATDYCVVQTVLDAVRLGFEPVVVLDAVRAVDLQPGDGQRSLDHARRAGCALI